MNFSSFLAKVNAETECNEEIDDAGLDDEDSAEASRSDENETKKEAPKCKSFLFIYLRPLLNSCFLVPGSGVSLSIMSDQTFEALRGSISDHTLAGIKDMGFTNMTEIQAKTIPALLEGR